VEALSPPSVISSQVAVAERLDNFAHNLRLQLRERGWTAPELARRAGLSAKTVNNVLNGRHAAQKDVLTKLADALNLELWQMWLPQLPKDASHDETFPRLVTTAAKLSPEACARVAHIVDLELKAATK
jgi:transcriptional regulator with XRE-family HTH domain